MTTARPRVVILGGGFGGLTLLKGLRHVDAEVVLVDRRNHHLFQPLLYQVATAALSSTEIAQPIRAILRGAQHLTIMLDEAVGLDLANRQVLLERSGPLAYDMLVVATGVEYDYFGHPDWALHAPSLKSLADATEIRRRLLLAFEMAETEPDPARRQRWLTVVLVGGGPTGVELAGSIAELARFALRSDFRHIDPADTRVILVEAGSRLLNGFADPLSAYALRALRRLHVDVRLDTMIDGIDAEGVSTRAGHIPAGLVIWCAGVRGTRPGGWLEVPLSRTGTVPVGRDLSVAGHPEIFVIGDLAAAAAPAGHLLPQVAPVAKQQGAYVARVIAARVAGKPPPPAFAFKDPGSLAVIGRSAAVVDFGWVRLTGFIGWLVWGLAHIFFLIGFHNRLAVFLAWLWEWATYKRGSRLIAERPRAGREEAGRPDGDGPQFRTEAPVPPP